MNTMELIYARGSMLGRDLFHYIVSGIVFALSLPSLFIAESLTSETNRFALTLELNAWLTIGIGVVLIVTAYVLGHVMLPFGFVIS